MINTHEKQTPIHQFKVQKAKKKHYHIDPANNFACYKNLRLLVSEPQKYFLVHVVIICGMVYFYSLTFVVGLIVYEINYFVIALHVIVTCLMIALGFKNPGIVLKITEDFDSSSKIEIPFDRDSKPAINQLAKSYSFPIKSHSIGLRFCPQCLIYRPPRTVHCWVCNACILNMDHHCPFIGNCVGKGNYHIFFAFVLTLTIKLILVITQLIIMIVRMFNKFNLDTFQKPQIYFTFILLVFSFVVLAFVGTLLGFHLYLIVNSLTTNQLCKKTWNTVSGNPFRKNFCIKNILKFIRGPINHSMPQSNQNIQKTMIPRGKDKSEQYLSEYESEQPANERLDSNSNNNSLVKSQGPQKPESLQNKEITNTQSNIVRENMSNPCL